MRHSDGWYHERISKYILYLFIPFGVIVFCINSWFGFGFMLGLFCGFFIDPDLDHRQSTRCENRMYRIWKPLGVVFAMYWTPYQAMWPHGSDWTHGGGLPLGWLVMALVSTPIRIIYSLLWIVPLLVYWPTDVWNTFIGIHPFFWLGLYTGWALQDLGHWLRDYIFDSI